MIVTNSLTGGGAERSMNLICNELTKRGWEISLVPINSGPEDQIVPICEVFPLERPWKGSIISTILAMWKFHKVVQLWKPDVIVLNCDLPELLGATYLGNHDLVLVEHASSPWGQRMLLGRLVRRILAFRKAKAVAVSPHLTIWPSGKKPYAVLQNPVTPTGRMGPRSPGEGTKRLIFIGRLSEEKRPDFALEISRRAGVELLFIGDGPLRTKLQEDALVRSTQVTFLGRIDNPWAEIRSGDLLIVPSAFEGDGLVVIEGLQHQIPMLLSDISDLRRFRFPNENYCRGIEDFVSKVTTSLSNLPALLIPRTTSESILSSRSIAVIGDAWEEFLNQIHHG